MPPQLHFARGFRFVGHLVVIVFRILFVDVVKWGAVYLIIVPGFGITFFLLVRDEWVRAFFIESTCELKIRSNNYIDIESFYICLPNCGLMRLCALKPTGMPPFCCGPQSEGAFLAIIRRR